MDGRWIFALQDFRSSASGKPSSMTTDEGNSISSRSAAAVIDIQATAAPPTATSLDDHGLRAHFRRGRIFGGATAVVAVIAIVMLLLHGDGLTVESFSAGEKNDAELKGLLDYYNSISGSVGSFVSKPVEIYIGLLVAAAYLCFQTSLTLDPVSIGRWQYLPLLSAAVLGYLFSNGLNSLNVQVTPGVLVSRIIAKDVAFTKGFEDDQPLLANGSLATTWDHTFAENASGNSVLNTILRSKLLPFEKVKAQCSGVGSNDTKSPFRGVPLVSFGFQSRSWQSETLAITTKPTDSLKISMNSENPSTELSGGARRLPFPVEVASNLVLVGIEILYTLGLHDIDAIDRYPTAEFEAEEQSLSGNVRAADLHDLLPPSGLSSSSFLSGDSSTTTTSHFLNASHALFSKAFGLTMNASVDDASVEYHRVDLSDAITFDALTIELPVAKLLMDTSGHVRSKTDGGYDAMRVADFCSRDGCVTPATVINLYGQLTTIQPRVQVASICVNDDGTEDLTIFYDDLGRVQSPCNRTSSNSMFVVGVGVRIDGDHWDKNESDSVMRLKNLHTVYSVTVGRLSWETEDLAKAFGADCDIDGGCEGLRFRMTPHSEVERRASDFLVVGTNNLPVADLGRLNLESPYQTKWRYLVSVANAFGKLPLEVLRPRLFSSVDAKGAALRTTPAERCNSFVDEYITAVEKNHLFMEHSLQASYTAAFYFLFQDAVRQQRLNTTSDSTSSLPQLAFAGNLQRMNVQVSIPTTNAVISLLGCLLLFGTSVGIMCLARRSEHLLQQRASAEVVAEALMNSTKYPPWLLTMALEQPPTSSRAEISPVPLQRLRVQHVVLHHTSNEDEKHAFHVGSEM